MKHFADLHLKPQLDSPERTRRLIGKARELGYSLLGISLTPDIEKETFLSLQEVCRESAVGVATRIDLTPRSTNELLRSLKRFRRRFEIVSVNCLSKAIARQAAKDRRVDLLAFPSSDPRDRFFDRAETRVASQGVAAMEINMSLILESSGFSRARLFYFLRRETAIAQKAGFPTVISSHASDPFQMRGPYDFASLAQLFGMGYTSAVDALSTTPFGIVNRNRKKLDADYVAMGIRVVRRGRNCDK